MTQTTSTTEHEATVRTAARRPSPRHRRPRPGPGTGRVPLAESATETFPPEEPGDLRGTAIRSVAWVAFQRWGSRISGLVVFALLGRLLDPADLGLAALATVFVMLFQLLADQGFSTALIQKKHIDDVDRNTAFWISVGSSIVLMGAIILASPLIADALDQPRLAPILCGMSPALLFGALCGTPEALLERDFQFRSLAMRTVFASIVSGIAGVTVAALGGGVWGIVVQSVGINLVSAVFLWTVTPWRPGLKVSRESARELRTTGLSVLGIQAIGLASGEGDKFIVGAFLGPSALGYYFIASRVVTILVDVQTSVIEAISLTTLSKLQSNMNRLRDAFYKLTGLGAASAIATFALLAATTPVILPLVFGAQWLPASATMQVLCLMGCLNSIIVFDRNALIAVGAARAALVITVVQTVIGLSAIGLAAQWGVLAVAIAATARQYVVWPLRLRTIKRHLGVDIRTYLAQWFGPITSGLVVYAVGQAVNQVWEPHTGLAMQLGYLLVQALIGAGIYVVTMRWTSRMAYAEFRQLAVDMARKIRPPTYPRHLAES